MSGFEFLVSKQYTRGTGCMDFSKTKIAYFCHSPILIAKEAYYGEKEKERSVGIAVGPE